MAYQARDIELEDIERIQHQGNNITDFKPKDEEERDATIQKEVSLIRELAKNYTVLRDSIDNFRAVEGNAEAIRAVNKPLKPRKLDAAIIRKSKEEIIQHALKLVCETLNAQSAAIFLISKDGLLERFGFYGVDKENQVLDNRWFGEESYQVGESFTGKAVQPRKGSNYGEIQYAPLLSDENLKSECRKQYLSRFESLKCAIAIPLNGRNRTYGVLRVLNKLNSGGALSKESFSLEDVQTLLFLATSIANTLSNFRRDVQVEILEYLSRLLVQPPPSTEPSFCQQAIDLLIQNSETAFKAGILRIKNDTTQLLEVEAESLAAGVIGTRDNEPRKSNDREFLWITADRQKRLILQDVQTLLEELRRKDRQVRFRNEEWIMKNRFQSFGCFPLVAQGVTVGTLSLYAGYNYNFSPDSIDFIQGVTDLLSTFLHTAKLEKQLAQLPKKVIESDKGEDISIDPQLEATFRALADQWKQDTEYSSSMTEILEHSAYQDIIKLGDPVVPLLLKDLSETDEPQHWFGALRAITGANPVSEKHQGRIAEMKEDWLDWGRDKKLCI